MGGEAIGDEPIFQRVPCRRDRTVVFHSPARIARLRPVDLDVETGTIGDAALLRLRGEIDVYTAPRLRQAIIDLVDGGATRIVVDMEKVDFLDSTGLGVLVGGLKRVRMKEGSLAIVTSQDKILKIFDITGLNKVFPIHSSLEEAVPGP
jgi:anti-sigma B factor antagonist